VLLLSACADRNVLLQIAAGDDSDTPAEQSVCAAVARQVRRILDA
jgi:hypothetical protein